MHSLLAVKLDRSLSVSSHTSRTGVANPRILTKEVVTRITDFCNPSAEDACAFSIGIKTRSDDVGDMRDARVE